MIPTYQHAVFHTHPEQRWSEKIDDSERRFEQEARPFKQKDVPNARSSSKRKQLHENSLQPGKQLMV
jgi:hypothetical protein